MKNRARAVELYVKALRTGEASATATAATNLATDVVLDTVGRPHVGQRPRGRSTATTTSST